MKNIIIFDLDGTLALIDHRKHLVECEREKQDWDAFYEACDKDEPNPEVMKLFVNLADNCKTDDYDENDIYDVRIFSGRSESVRIKTVEWRRIEHPRAYLERKHLAGFHAAVDRSSDVLAFHSDR